MNTISYRIRNTDLANPIRTVDVAAQPDQIEQFVSEGYLLRENLLTPEQVATLKAAVDEVAAGERGDAPVPRGGVLLRQLLDKHPAFLDMLTFGPTLSVARALLGPQVQLRNFTARIAYPGGPAQETD